MLSQAYTATPPRLPIQVALGKLREESERVVLGSWWAFFFRRVRVPEMNELNLVSNNLRWRHAIVR